MTVTETVLSTAELDCRRRHPSMRPGVSNQRLQVRMATALANDGAEHALVASAVLSARGRSGLAPEVFAARLGVPVETLIAAEAGRIARADLPGPMQRLVPRPD